MNIHKTLIVKDRMLQNTYTAPIMNMLLSRRRRPKRFVLSVTHSFRIQAYIKRGSSFIALSIKIEQMSIWLTLYLLFFQMFHETISLTKPIIYVLPAVKYRRHVSFWTVCCVGGENQFTNRINIIKFSYLMNNIII